MAYTAVDLGAFTAHGLNNAGQVVGYSGGAVLWQDGALINLGAGSNSSALAVNDAGRVAGRGTLGGSQFHAFLWDQSSGFTDLGTLPNRPYSQAADLNEAGQVVGASSWSSSSSSLEGARAFLWDATTGMQDLGTFGQNSATATAINEAGQLVGFAQYSQSGWTTFATQNAAFFRDTSGATTMLGSLPGHLFSKALDINDLGQVVGSSGDQQIVPHSVTYRPQEAFVWQNGAMTGLGKPAGYLRSEAVAINNAGQVVSFAYPSPYSSPQVFLWDNGVWTDLGFYYPRSADINDLGQILVVASDHSFLLTPDTITGLAISDASVTEGNAGMTLATFTVTRSGPLGGTTTVHYATADGSALGSDYEAAKGMLTFAPDENSKTITIRVSGDRLVEPNESYFVGLSAATGATILDAQGVGTILDDEPRISISDVTMAEGKKGQTTLFNFTVTLSNAYDQPVTMSFATANGTAKTSDNDYVAKSGTLTFAPGETTKTITIDVKGDNKREVNETFYLDLFGNSSNALFTKSRGVGTILNDD